MAPFVDRDIEHPIEQFLLNGYTIWRKAVDPIHLYELAYHKCDYDYPSRGFDHNGQFYINPSNDIALAKYWTGPVSDNSYVKNLRDKVDRLAGACMFHPIFYEAEVHVIKSNCRLITNDVVVPYCYHPWSGEAAKHSKTKSVQFAVPMNVIGDLSGMPAFVSKSHKNWQDRKNILCHRNIDDFLVNAELNDWEFTDVYMYDGRIHHGFMSNLTKVDRYILLLTYVEDGVLESLMDKDSTRFF